MLTTTLRRYCCFRACVRCGLSKQGSGARQKMVFHKRMDCCKFIVVTPHRVSAGSSACRLQHKVNEESDFQKAANQKSIVDNHRVWCYHTIWTFAEPALGAFCQASRACAGEPSSLVQPKTDSVSRNRQNPSAIQQSRSRTIDRCRDKHLFRSVCSWRMKASELGT